jgi:hypothetical protein
MATGFRLLSNDLARNADINAFNRLQVKALDGSGSTLFRQDQASLSRTTQRGLLLSAADRNVARVMRQSPAGTLRIGSSQCLFWDQIEGSTIDQQRWTQFTNTISPAQAVGTGTAHGSSTTMTTNSGTLLVSNRYFPFTGRSSLIFRTRVRFNIPFAPGSVAESGFGSPTSAIPLSGSGSNAVNGAHWRRDGDGNFIPVLAIQYPSAGLFPEFFGTTVSPATVRALISPNDYFYLEVELQENRAIYRISTQDGTLVNEQAVNFPQAFPLNVASINIAAGGTFTTTHLRVFHRVYQTLANTTVSATQSFVAQTSVWQLDRWTNPDYNIQQASLPNMGSLCSPIASGSFSFNTQIANYPNSLAPTAQGQSNTTVAAQSLGGQYALSGSLSTLEFDSMWVGAQTPTSMGFVVTRINISCTYSNSNVNPNMESWEASFNCSALSLATGGTYPPRFKTLGLMSWLAGATGQAQQGDVTWEGKEWIAPGRFFTVSCKPFHTNSNTSTTKRLCICVDGYFE